MKRVRIYQQIISDENLRLATNANSSVSPDTHLLYLDVESRELKDQYSFSSDRRSVTFDSSYELQWQFYNEPFTTTATANLKRVIEMQDLI